MRILPSFLKSFFFSCVLLSLVSTDCSAKGSPKGKAPSRTPQKSAAQGKARTPGNQSSSGVSGSRSSELVFEDEIVEGMNKNPFDSLTQTRTGDDRSFGKLYRRRVNMKNSLKMTVREMGIKQ